MKLGIGRVALENTGNIGKAYRRHDEVGTPLCLTVDFETIEKIWLKWMNKEISAREILSHIQDGYGKPIRVELL